MKIRLKDVIVALLAVTVAGGTGYFLAYQQYDPGVRYLAKWIRASEPARSAYDPSTSGIISEDPAIFIPSDDSTQWHLDIAGQVEAKTRENIRGFLLKWQKLPNPHPYVRIVADNTVHVSTVMDILQLCAECGFEDIDVNGFAGHNYKRHIKK